MNNLNFSVLPTVPSSHFSHFESHSARSLFYQSAFHDSSVACAQVHPFITPTHILGNCSLCLFICFRDQPSRGNSNAQSFKTMSSNSIPRPSQGNPPLVLLAAWLQNAHDRDDQVVSWVAIPGRSFEFLTRLRTDFQQTPPKPSYKLGPPEHSIKCRRSSQSCLRLSITTLQSASG